MAAIDALQRVCVKLYGDEPGFADTAFVPIFHEWIREHVIPDLVLFDVADYAHAPDSPGIVLVAHDAHIAMDRSDGRFGIHVQRRVDAHKPAREVLAQAIRWALEVADRLEADPRLSGKIRFDRSALRVEANDRLRAPNTDEAWRGFEPLVRDAVTDATGGAPREVSRLRNDPRDRLTADVTLASGVEAGIRS